MTIRARRSMISLRLVAQRRGDGVCARHGASTNVDCTPSNAGLQRSSWTGGASGSVRWNDGSLSSIGAEASASRAACWNSPPGCEDAAGLFAMLGSMGSPGIPKRAPAYRASPYAMELGQRIATPNATTTATTRSHSTTGPIYHSLRTTTYGAPQSSPWSWNASAAPWRARISILPLGALLM